MVKAYEIAAGKVLESTDESAPILLYVNPDAEEKRRLVDVLKLDEHTLHSALDPDELPRLEFEPEHLAAIVKRPRKFSEREQFLFRVNSMGLFLYKDRLVIVVPEDGLALSGKVFQNVATLPDVMLGILYNSIFHFLEHLKVISMMSDDLEHKINTSMENRHLLGLFALIKSLVYYLNAIRGNGVIIARLKNAGARIGLTVAQTEFLDDISVENDQCYKLAEIHSNVFSSLMDARASIVNNNLSVLMKTLNMITIGIMVPTFVVSAFSMNVPIPLQRYATMFWLILGLAAASGFSVLAYWRYKRFW